MHPFFHQKRITSVQQLDETVSAQTIHLDTGSETVAQIWVEPHTFKITRARLELLRNERGIPTDAYDVSALHGIEAYFGCGKPFRTALKPYPPLAAELFLENVSALIQAETFLIKERGYSSLEAYVDHWKTFYTGSCRYYSSLEAVKRSWGDYVSSRHKGTILFNRFKVFTLDRWDNGLILRASMTDSFHEMSCALRLDLTGGSVREATGAILRAPDHVCSDAAVFITRLNGSCFPNLNRDAIATILGKKQGCVHLIDLTCEAAKFLKTAPGFSKTNS
ncbi:MAG: DUF2889 domain-containing protein [Firmicutes bacterium]|nr:DUF2889 domain-containing protein [Bacillota bacterium]